MKNLIIRTITGAVFVAAIIASAILSPIAFALLFLAMALPGMFEFQRLTRKQNKLGRALPGLLVSLLVYGIMALYALSYLEAMYLWMIIPLVIILLLYHLFYGSQRAISMIASDTAGLLFVVFPMALLNLYLNPFHTPEYHTPWLVLGTLVILWTHDTFAYLTGSIFGKHPLSRSISPGKSWEGSIGGLVFGVVAAYILSIYSSELELWHWLVIAFMVSFFGTAGDLSASLLKRRASVKDSGKLLPGHGGILDRFDSLLLVSPLVFVFILLFSS